MPSPSLQLLTDAAKLLTPILGELVSSPHGPTIYFNDLRI
jgi:hypothetical protein